METKPDEKGAGGEPDESPDNGKAETPSSKGQNPDNKACPCCHKGNHSNELPWWRDSQWWQVIVAGVLVPFGIYAVIVYSGQLDEMRKTTEAASDAAKAAKDSIKLATENARLDQRAWVGVKSIDGLPEAGNPYKVRVVFKNTGKTFADKVIVRMAVERVPRQMIPDFDKVEALAEGKGSGILAPDGTIEGVVETEIEVVDEEIVDIEMGKRSLYVHGVLTYTDIFQCDHWITFCYTLVGSRKSGWGHLAYETHNKTDNNCGPKIGP